MKHIIFAYFCIVCLHVSIKGMNPCSRLLNAKRIHRRALSWLCVTQGLRRFVNAWAQLDICLVPGMDWANHASSPQARSAGNEKPQNNVLTGSWQKTVQLCHNLRHALSSPSLLSHRHACLNTLPILFEASSCPVPICINSMSMM